MSFYMLTSKPLMDILSQMSMDCFEDILILRKTGKLLAYHGKNENDIDMLTVIASNIWALYENIGSVGLKEDSLNLVMLDFTGGKLAITKISEFLVCLRSKQSAEMGFVYASVESLKECLEKPLKNIIE